MAVFNEMKHQELQGKLKNLCKQQENIKKLLDLVKEDIRDCLQELVNIKDSDKTLKEVIKQTVKA